MNSQRTTPAADMLSSLGRRAMLPEAFAMTAACFVGLSLYAVKSGKDFQWMGGLLSMGLMGARAHAVGRFPQIHWQRNLRKCEI